MLVALALPLAWGTAGAEPAAPQGPRSIRVDSSTTGAQHPLDLEVLGYTVTGTPLVTSTTGPTGYVPSTIQKYLGLTGNGAGQTIAIVAAYDDLNIASDLAKFDTTFGLPAPPSFKKVNQTGGTTYPKADPGWSLEIALDVEWAHAVAPGASILLVEAKDSSFTNMNAAITYASKQVGVSVISNSWGGLEFSGEATLDGTCKLTAAVCVFSTGDKGNPGSYPAYSPYVIAVGGTTLNLTTNATTGTVSVTGETAWSGSGGGVSTYEARPSYQTTVNTNTKRGTPDVSYGADPATGFAVYDSVAYQGQTGWFQMGGTSAGAPQWAGILAVTNQLRKAAGKAVLAAYPSNIFKAHTALYGLTSGLADITTGTNGACGTNCTAKTGYDFVTGRGSPRPGIDVALKAAA
jgi:subtilase family serine protease